MEENTGVPVDELLQRRSVFRALYILLFCRQSNPLAAFANLHKNGFINVVSFTKNSELIRRQSLQSPEQLFNQNFPNAPTQVAAILERRPQRPAKFTDVTSLAACPSLPLLCEVAGQELHFVYTKTMTALHSLALPTHKLPRFFRFDKETLKFLVLDNSGTAYLYRFSLDLNQVDLIFSSGESRFVSGAFLPHSTAVLLLSDRSELFVYNLLWKRLEQVGHVEAGATDVRLEFCKDANCLVVVNKPRGTAWTLNLTDFTRRDTFPGGPEEITCFHIHRRFVLLGYSTGLLRVVLLPRMTVVLEQVFEETEGRRARLDAVTVCSDFIVVALNSGSVLIVGKL